MKILTLCFNFFNNVSLMNFKIFFSLAIISVLLFSCNTNSSLKTETFKVWGNCEKCKKTIESAVSVNGVTHKDWNVGSKLMTITFDTTKVKLGQLQQLIAKSGYDNDKFYGDDYSYDKLETCCQYERKPFE